MNVQALSSPLVSTSHLDSDPKNLSADLKLSEAFMKVDISNIKEALKEGANPSLTITPPLEIRYPLALLEQALNNDPELMQQGVLWLNSLLFDAFFPQEANLDDADFSDFQFFSNINNKIQAGYTFSNEFNHSLIVLVQDLLELSAPNIFIDDFYDEFPEDWSLFEFSLMTRDLELMELILERGLRPVISELEDPNFFGDFAFTRKNIQMIELMEKYGYSLQQLLGEDETFENILEDAYENDDILLVKFFERRGYTLETLTMFEKCSFVEHKA